MSQRSKSPPPNSRRSLQAQAARPPDDVDEDDQEQVPVALASSIREGRVAWLLPGLLPLGTISVLEADKGTGKSCLAASTAAAVTGGPALPGCRKRRPAPVIWFAGEEDVPTMTRPKLRAAGADLNYVWFPGWDTRGELLRPWLFPGDLSRLARLLTSTGARLCVLDPFSSFVPSTLNLCSPQEARRLCEELAHLAARTQSLFLVTRNLSKSPSRPLLYQGLGSIEIGNVSRSILRVDITDAVTGRRCVRRVAGNLGGECRPLLFDLPAPDGQPRVVWRGTCAAEELELGATPDDPGERDALADARRFLRLILCDGRKPVKEILRAANDAAITLATLRRAKKAERIISVARGARSERVWYWQLPGA